jgi:hypothetical protein
VYYVLYWIFFVCHMCIIYINCCHACYPISHVFVPKWFKAFLAGCTIRSLSSVGIVFGRLLVSVSSERRPPSLLPPPVSCCSTLEDKDFLEHEVHGVELISTLSSPGSLICMVAKYGYLCTWCSCSMSACIISDSLLVPFYNVCVRVRWSNI